MSAETISQLLRMSVLKNANRAAFILLADGETQEVPLTVGELDQAARQVGARLQKLGLEGERVLLVFPFCLEFYMAFLGCSYAGAVAVLAYPPRPDRPLDPLQNMVLDSGAKAVLTLKGYAAALSPQFPNFPALQSLHWLAVDEIRAQEDPTNWVEPALSGDSPALLSYTSGSTNYPKGVLISHRNLISSMAAFKTVLPAEEELTGIMSNPMYHIGGVALPLAVLMTNVRVILLPIEHVLAKPSRWLQAISRYQAEVAVGFSFFFQMALQIPPEIRDQMDLRSLRYTFIGYERINALLLERFIQYYEPIGFRREVFRPGYGLTELSSITTLKEGLHHALYDQRKLQQNQAVPLTDSTQGGVDIVCCGRPLLGELVIVHPETLSACPDNEIGEVWARGPHMALGYWNQPEETKTIFQAYRSDTGDGPYLRTGDLGFMQNGELYIAGRRKEVIILHGKNYHAPDFEAALFGAHAAFTPGGTAAIGVNVMGTEQLAIVQEVIPGTPETVLEEAVERIRERISLAFEHPVYAVGLIEQGKLPRTSTGKIQRYRCLEAFESGKLPFLKISLLAQEEPAARQNEMPEERLPRNSTESALLGIWMGILKRTDIGIHDNFFTLGGNSLQAVQIVSHVRDVFQVELQMQGFFQEPTIASMARYIEQARSQPMA